MNQKKCDFGNLESLANQKKIQLKKSSSKSIKIVIKIGKAQIVSNYII